MKEPIYKISHDVNSKIYIKGPAPGGQCSYHGGSLYPDSRFDTEIEANRVAAMMNIAYIEGYEKAQSDIRVSLGFKKTILS